MIGLWGQWDAAESGVGDVGAWWRAENAVDGGVPPRCAREGGSSWSKAAKRIECLSVVLREIFVHWKFVSEASSECEKIGRAHV